MPRKQKTRAQRIAEGLIPPSKQTAAEKVRETARLIKVGAKMMVGGGPKRTAKPKPKPTRGRKVARVNNKRY